MCMDYGLYGGESDVLFQAAALYKESLTLHFSTEESAKTHSNLAAALAKLDRDEEAAYHAERATILAPDWAKGWWRRGSLALIADSHTAALAFHSRAAELEPENKEFRKALHEAEMAAAAAPAEKGVAAELETGGGSKSGGSKLQSLAILAARCLLDAAHPAAQGVADPALIAARAKNQAA